MKLSEFRKKYNLHDSPINGLSYFPEQGRLIMGVAICDDGQQWPTQIQERLREDGMNPLPLNLVFTGVPYYSVSPGTLDFENDEINHERLLPSRKPGKEMIEFCLLTTSKWGTEGVRFLRIEAEGVDWDLS
ncbi:MAG TPA: hypothetical protein VFV38_02755 [Ktedonobacteraceae bacterium]|nr:hypothetical protein [Ktedonobacteraceae bacterium]